MPDAKPHPLAWLPNALTTSRMLSIPLLVWAILGLANTPYNVKLAVFALGLFALAAFTDFLDGFLARRWKVVSAYGRMIDPIADKLLVAGCLIAFGIITHGLWMILVPALAIIGRDILVSGAREHAANHNIILPPTRLAKWKTGCEMLAIALLMCQYIHMATGYGPFFYGGIAVLWLAALLSVYTGTLYFLAALKK